MSYSYEIVPLDEVDPDFHKSIFQMYSMCTQDLSLKPLPTIQYIKELRGASQGRKGKSFQCQEQIGGLFNDEKKTIQVKLAAVDTTRRFMANACRQAWHYAQGGEKLKDFIRKHGSGDIERDAEQYSDRAIKAIKYFPNHLTAARIILRGQS